MSIEALKDVRVVTAIVDPTVKQQVDRVTELAGMINIGSAQDGRKALHLAISKRPDLVVLDARLPIQDGIVAARSILMVYKPCIILVTAPPDGHLRGNAAEIGVADSVITPLDAMDLLYTLSDIYARFVPSIDGARILA